MLRLFFSIILSLFSLLSIAQAEQAEVINDFDSYIVVNKNAALNITEKITVYTSLQTIKHGIVRNLPTIYQDSDGKIHHVIYRIDEALKNNQPTPFFLTRKKNHLLVTMGDMNVLLTPGYYTFTLKYRVQDGVSFLKTVDKLNWNVTGSEWEFPILHASLQIELPKDGIITHYSGYTGILGAEEQHYKVQQIKDNQLRYVLLSSLALGESFAISVSWNKGIVEKPTWFETLRDNILQKNANQMIKFIATLLLAYYLYLWYRSSPQRFSTQIPIFTPPDNLSPSILRFLYRMQFDLKTLSVAIISMASKGYLKIQRENDTFILTKLNNDTELDVAEQKLAKKLFAKEPSFVLTSKHSRILHKIKIDLSKYLKKNFHDHYFGTNIIYFIPGFVLGLIAFIIAIFSSKDYSASFFAIIWLTGWSAACFAFAIKLINQTKLIFAHFSLGQLLKISFTLIGCIFFILIDLLGLFIFSKSIDVMIVFALFSILIVNFIFYFLLKIPTAKGLSLIQQIEGFKLFLKTPNRYQFNQFNHLDLRHLFEKYLPYAIALDVETNWIEEFHKLLQTSRKAGDYHPKWYQTEVIKDSSINYLADLGNELTNALATASHVSLSRGKKIKVPPTSAEAKQTETLD